MMVNRITPHLFIRGYSTRPPSIRKLLATPNIGDCRVQGWIRSARKQKQTSFLDIGDGSCSQSLQVVATSAILPKELNFHSCVMVEANLDQVVIPSKNLNWWRRRFIYSELAMPTILFNRGKLPAKNMSEVNPLAKPRPIVCRL